MAIASMVLGLLCLPTMGALGIPAVVTGHIAKSQLRARPRGGRRHGDRRSGDRLAVGGRMGADDAARRGVRALTCGSAPFRGPGRRPGRVAAPSDVW
ncbi:DUF4190 domain-containing protein [Kitasatospora arboriphila]